MLFFFWLICSVWVICEFSFGVGCCFPIYSEIFSSLYFGNGEIRKEKNDVDDDERKRILKDEILLVLHKKATRKRGVRRIQIK